jgi:hypothetical protein
VCRHCTRDVSVFRALLDELQTLRQENLALQSSRSNSANAGGSEAVPCAEAAPAPNTGPPRRTWPVGVAALATVLMLGVLHWVLFFLYDTPVVAFRILTFFVPIGAGIWAARAGRSFWLSEWAISLLAGITSVVLMLHITHLVDGVPLWPQDLRDWRETVEYATSISLAMITGLLAQQAYVRWQLAQQSEATLFKWQRDGQGRLKLEKLTSDVQDLVSTLAPVVSGVMAVYSALKSLWG